MNLREAAQQATPREQLLKELMDSRVPKTEREHAAVREIERLRAALAEDAMQRFTNEQQMIERGTKAWAGVQDATDWVEEMRGNKPTLIINGMPAVEGPLSKAHRTYQESRQVEPAAYVTGYSKGRCIIEAVDPAWLLPVGMALYRSPPKRKPMTEQQLDEMFDQAEIAIYIADRQQKEHLGVYSFGVRDAEKWHGIGGEE